MDSLSFHPLPKVAFAPFADQPERELRDEHHQVLRGGRPLGEKDAVHELIDRDVPALVEVQVVEEEPRNATRDPEVRLVLLHLRSMVSNSTRHSSPDPSLSFSQNLIPRRAKILLLHSQLVPVGGDVANHVDEHPLEQQEEFPAAPGPVLRLSITEIMSFSSLVRVSYTSSQPSPG